MLKLVVLFAVVAVACAGNKLMENRKLKNIRNSNYKKTLYTNCISDFNYNSEAFRG